LIRGPTLAADARMATLASLHRCRTLRVATIGVLLALLPCAGCGGNGAASAEGGPIDARAPIDLCDAFTGAGSACPGASPLVCFPMCEAGGCFCHETPDGPRWACVTDRSCQQPCAPIEEDACAEASGGMGSE
jgi:hypothetical protein